MKKLLQISPDLKLPAAETTTGTIVVYGGKGMGKTNFGAVVCEELAATGQRFCYIDPVGVAWGLRHSADGKGEGLKILILGGRHGDVPIEPTGGTIVADFVSDSRDNVLIDISSRADGRRWTIPEKVRFVASYMTRLLERNAEHRRPIMQIIDEAARFAPQMAMKGSDAAIDCLNAIEVFVEEGRNAGCGVMLLTQRSARMAKSVSELAEAMVAFRIIGPNSVAAVLDWFGEHVPKARWNDLVEQLRKLPRGQALVVSPGWLDYEGIATMRLRRTFDSSKTPTGTERRLARAVKPADLDKLRAAIAETVEKAEAADPTKLRQRMRELEAKAKQLETDNERLRLRPAAPATSEKASELRAELSKTRAALKEAMKLLIKVKAVNFDGRSRDALESAITEAVRSIVKGVNKDFDTASTKLDDIKRAIAETETRMEKLLAGELQIQVDVERAPAKPATTNIKTAAVKPPKPSKPLKIEPREGDLSQPEQRILNSLAWWEAAGVKRPTREQVAFGARYTLNGHTRNTIGELRKAGLLDYPDDGHVSLTAEGRAKATVTDDTIASREELLQRVYDVLRSDPQKRIFRAAATAGAPVTREELAEKSNYTVNGHFRNTVGELKKIGVLKYPSEGLVTIGDMFDL